MKGVKQALPECSAVGHKGTQAEIGAMWLESRWVSHTKGPSSAPQPSRALHSQAPVQCFVKGRGAKVESTRIFQVLLHSHMTAWAPLGQTEAKSRSLSVWLSSAASQEHY